MESGQAQQPRKSLWRRRNDAESRVRRAIEGRPGLRIFGIGMDEDQLQGEFFVTLTAANEEARRDAPKLLNGCSGLSANEWADGWRRLKLGDWMIRVYPERDRGLSA